MQLRLSRNRARIRGSALVEVAMGYGMLVIVAMISLKSSINAVTGQSWTVKQTMSDAFLTRETALASRIPFDDAIGASSSWPVSPDVATSTVTIGRLPGGNLVSATLHRTRIADTNNLTTAGGSGTAATNPHAFESWRLQSILVYEVNGRSYMKSRTTVRTR